MSSAREPRATSGDRCSPSKCRSRSPNQASLDSPGACSPPTSSAPAAGRRIPAKRRRSPVASMASIPIRIRVTGNLDQFAMSVMRAGKNILTGNFWKEWATDFGISQVNLFIRIASLCHQSLVTVDAIARSIVRMTRTE